MAEKSLDFYCGRIRRQVRRTRQYVLHARRFTKEMWPRGTFGPQVGVASVLLRVLDTAEDMVREPGSWWSGRPEEMVLASCGPIATAMHRFADEAARRSVMRYSAFERAKMKRHVDAWDQIVRAAQRLTAMRKLGAA